MSQLSWYNELYAVWFPDSAEIQKSDGLFAVSFWGLITRLWEVWISENMPHPQQAKLMSTFWDKIIKGKQIWSRLETDQVSRRHLSIFVRVYYDWLRSEQLGSMAINTFQHNNNKIIIFNFYLQFYFWDELIDCLWKIIVLWRVVQSGTLDTYCVCINASKSWKKNYEDKNKICMWHPLNEGCTPFFFLVKENRGLLGYVRPRAG